MRNYRINDIFYSIQGEGVRAGTAAVFVRFSGCNLNCNLGEHGFNCDTEFVSGADMTAEQIMDEVLRLCRGCDWVVLTGGEPALQLDNALIMAFKEYEIKIAIETNGTCNAPIVQKCDWVCVSPKTAEHTLAVKACDEVKYVRGANQSIPRCTIKAEHYLLSPASDALGINIAAVKNCIALVLENPRWRLSMQQHKVWKIC